MAVPISLLATYVYQVFKLFCTTMVERYDHLLEIVNDKAALNLNIILTLMYPGIFAIIAFFAILLKTLWKTNIAPFFFIGFVCAAYLALGAIPVAIISAGIAVYICLTDYSHIKEMNALKASGVAEVSDKEDFFND
ncbi:MAG: PTS sugar transporter subunit IIC [Lachnospiraceae bacterium]|nr:PTS sugar transporter subunit IIC [Lachnospiraceae bacterium]